MEHFNKLVFFYSFPVRAVPSYQRHIQAYEMPKILENSDKLSISTVTQHTRDWRVTVLVELYFTTLGELTCSAA
jgi:hypothetical protein